MEKPQRLVPGLDVRAGQVVACRYRIEERLGTGASGIVLAARHIHMRESVTLKILAAFTEGQDAVLEKRLARLRCAARLRGEHVAKIIDIGKTEAGPFQHIGILSLEFHVDKLSRPLL